MNQPPEPLPPPSPWSKPPRPWWVKLLIALGIAACFAVFAVVVTIGLVLYSCSHH